MCCRRGPSIWYRQPAELQAFKPQCKGFRDHVIRAVGRTHPIGVIKPHNGTNRTVTILYMGRESREVTNRDELMAYIAKSDSRFAPRIVVDFGDTVALLRSLNNCHVVMGMHGAGLTNALYLPDNGTVSLLCQVDASEQVVVAYTRCCAVLCVFCCGIVLCRVRLCVCVCVCVLFLAVVIELKGRYGNDSPLFRNIAVTRDLRYHAVDVISYDADSGIGLPPKVFEQIANIIRNAYPIPR